MGDLILKLPTDNVVMPPEERDNFLMLFPEQQREETNVSTTEIPMTPLAPPEKKLKQEIVNVVIFIGIFFILNLPQVRNLLVEYIPMCHKSWILTNLIQAIIFAFSLWLCLNAEYSKL